MNKHFLLCIICLHLIALLNAQPRNGKDYALFFANNDYSSNPDFLNLKNPIGDANAIAKELGEMFGFETIVYENLEKEEIYQKLELWQQRSFKKGDQLFVFFSGHGTFWEFTKKGYFIPRTSNAEYSSYIELTDLGNIITQIPCPHILLAVDACYSGTIDQEIAFKGHIIKRPNDSKESEKAQLITNQLRNTSRLLITSGGKQRTPDGVMHSPFTEAILRGLKSSYTHEDGLLTYRDILSRLERVSPTPHQGTLAGHDEGGFIFVAQPKTTTNASNNQSIKADETAEMIFVEGGAFLMGSRYSGFTHEKPAHNVTVDDFYMAKYEVTVHQFSQFVAATKYTTLAETEKRSTIYNTDKASKNNKADVNWRHNEAGELRPQNEYNHPVIHISWLDAINYCNWKSEQEGFTKVYEIHNIEDISINWNANGYRLPTEAEWEYAARSKGKKTKWAGTSDEAVLGLYANYKQADSLSGYIYTAPVGQFESNELGIHDMSGNVWEWCNDRYSASYYRSSPQLNPKGENVNYKNRILRGGSWVNHTEALRCTHRFNNLPTTRNYCIGFRIVRTGK